MTPLPLSWTIDTRHGRAMPIVYAKFWSQTNVAAEVETHHTRQIFSQFQLSNFSESMQIVVSVSYS